jgi:MFS transporter, SP family, galactose:H+ symporter
LVGACSSNNGTNPVGLNRINSAWDRGHPVRTNDVEGRAGTPFANGALMKSPPFIFVVAGIAALSGLLFGYDTGVISGAILFIDNQFHLTPERKGLVMSGVLIGATISSMVSGRLTDYLGRRKVILLTAVVFTLGSMLCALAPSIELLVAGRVILGLAIGVASFTAPLYISEVSAKENRGALVGLNQLAIVIGILGSYLVDYIFSKDGLWQAMVGMGAVPAVILGLGMIWMPESPRWLVFHHREDEASHVLKRIRDTEKIAEELAEIRTSLQEEKASWAELFAPSLRTALLVGVGLGLFQQFTGINTVIYYAPSIFLMSGFTSNTVSILATAGVGLVNAVMTIIGLIFIDKLGRRPLLITGIIGMAFSLAALAISFALKVPIETMRMVGVGSLMLYVASFAVSLGPVFWLMISEIYPLKIRGLAMGFATSIQWLANAIVTYTFPILINRFGPSPTFSIYVAICLAAITFSVFVVPETKGLSLEEIENKGRARRPLTDS